MRLAIAAVLLGLGQPLTSLAATCSCAGAPVLVYLDTSAKEKGQLYISYTAEDHQINDLVSGSDDIRDETGRNRSTFSHVLSASYALTDHWSFSALVSHVEHQRKIGISALGKTTISGWGDSVLLARYTPLFMSPFSRHEFSLGAGVRLPTGESDVNNGFILSEDMQPGTGAYGGIAWASYAYAFSQSATLQYFASVNYLYNGENDRKYAFGNEFNLTTGLSQSLGMRWGWTAAVRYRNADPDERRGFGIPNSGGEWLDFVPAVRFSFGESFSATLSGRIPLARELNGALQFTTSYSYALSLSYGF